MARDPEAHALAIASVRLVARAEVILDQLDDHMARLRQLVTEGDVANARSQEGKP